MEVRCARSLKLPYKKCFPQLWVSSLKHYQQSPCSHARVYTASVTARRDPQWTTDMTTLQKATRCGTGLAGETFPESPHAALVSRTPYWINIIDQGTASASKIANNSLLKIPASLNKFNLWRTAPKGDTPVNYPLKLISRWQHDGMMWLALRYVKSKMSTFSIRSLLPIK